MIRPRTGTDDIHVYLCWYEFFVILFFKIQHWGTTAIFNNPYSSFQFLKIYMNLCTTSLLFYTTDTKHIFFKLKGGRPIPKTFLRGKKMIRRFWRGGRRKKILWIVQYTENRFKFGILFSSHYIRQNPKKKPSHIRPAEWLFVKGMGIEGVVTRPFFGNFKHT